MTDFIPFSRILGQQRAVRFLKGVLSRERIPHGYLFLGPPGVGKTTTAVALAQSLNCEAPREGDACGLCKSCRLIANNTFGDLAIVEPDGQVIKIEQIRELEHSLSFRPQHGKYRVTIIRESERMTAEAANAFLKTLEEPPHGNVLVLQAADLSQVMPTIVSRCQMVRFQPIPVPLIAEWLSSQKGIDPSRALLIARLSEGSISRAVNILEEDYESRRSESFSRLQELVDLPDGKLLDLAMELKGKSKEKERGSIELLLSLWKTWLRDQLLLKAGGPEQLVIHADRLAELKKCRDIYKIDYLMEGLALLDQAEKDMAEFRNLDLMLENLLFSLKALGKGGSAKGAGE